MDSIDVFHPPEIKSPSSAMIHRMRLFDALLAQPADDFEIGDNRGARAFGDFDGVGDMVEMAVRNQNVVRRDLIGLDVTGELVRRDERVA
jgi:hypothetical protein